MKRLDIIGQRFGSLTVVQSAGSNADGHSLFKCRCDCGTVVIRIGGNLKRSTHAVCPECQRTRTAERRTKHGLSTAPEYYVWRGILARCLNPKCEQYRNYGGRGITVCNRWQDSFVLFLEDVGRRPTPQHSIERKRNAGNYTPSNVVWATTHAQKRNTRRNRMVKFRGKTKPMVVWAEEMGMPYERLQKRLDAGWPVERALTAGNQNAKP